MAEKLRTNFKIGDILSPEDVNRTNATINANLDSIKATEDAATSAATSASSAAQAAENASGYLSDLQEAINDLPDGQAVTAEVAQHTVSIEGLEGATTLGQDEHGNDVKPSDVLQADTSETFINVVTDAEGHMMEAMREDGTKVFGGNIEAPNIQLHEEAIIQNAEDIEQFHGEFDDAMQQQGEVNAKSVLGQVEGEDVYPSDINQVAFGSGVIHGITDAEGHLLFWIDEEGNIQWVKGVPEPIKEYVSKNSGGNGGGFDSNCIQNVPNILDKNILGAFGQGIGFIRSNNPLVGYRWVFDNLEPSDILIKIDSRLITFETENGVKRCVPTEYMSRINTVIMYCNEHNLDVTVAIAKYPPYADDESGTIATDEFYMMIDYLLNYNGLNEYSIYENSLFPTNGYAISGSGDNKTYKCRIDNFRFFDELENKTDVHTAQEWLNLMAIVVTYVRQRSNKVKIFAPASGHYAAYHVIGSLTSNPDSPAEAKGFHFSDLFDYYCLDPYTREQIQADTEILRAYAASDPANSYCKTFKACSGYSPTAYSETEQGERMIEAILKHITIGAYNYYYFQPEYEQNEYPILWGDWENVGHLCCKKADGTGRIVNGYSYDDIIIGTGNQYWNNRVSLNNYQETGDNNLVSNLKSYGLQLSGNQISENNNLHITAVAIYAEGVTVTNDNSTAKSVIFTGDQDVYTTPLVLAASNFSDMLATDQIVIFTNAPKLGDANNTMNLKGIVPKDAALYLRELSKHLRKGSVRPTIKEYADFYQYSWYSGKPVYLFYPKRGVATPTISLSIQGNYYVTNLKGDIQTIDPASVSLSHPLYVLNSNNTKVL